ncbi:serine/arginine repetitive matrix protein 3-like [Melanerpes formicivorus]|uniref:serine/arginine repetitive matrix protein 3-like n=1 Tax=Melanerpes formicivorus TaxID=211600 RepID=UPI00358DDA40
MAQAAAACPSALAPSAPPRPGRSAEWGKIPLRRRRERRGEGRIGRGGCAKPGPAPPRGEEPSASRSAAGSEALGQCLGSGLGPEPVLCAVLAQPPSARPALQSSRRLGQQAEGADPACPVENRFQFTVVSPEPGQMVQDGEKDLTVVQVPWLLDVLLINSGTQGQKHPVVTAGAAAALGDTFTT